MPINQAAISDTGLMSDSGLFSDTWYTPLESPFGGSYSMYYSGYWIAYNWGTPFTDGSEVNWKNLEELMTAPPRGEYVPQGEVEEQSLAGSLRRDGRRDVALYYPALHPSAIIAYCDFLWSDNTDGYNSDFDGLGVNSSQASVPVTVALKNRDGIFNLYNAWAHMPVEGRGYRRVNDFQLDDIELRFTLKE